LADYFNANCPTYGINTSQDEDLEQENSEGVMDLTPSNNIRSLHSYLREEEGSKKSVRLRQQDMIPGILYGSDPTQNILSTDNNSRILVKTPLFQLQRELDRFTYHNFESRVYDLTLYSNEEDTEGTIHRVLPKNVQFHPVQNKLYCVNYLRYHPGRPIKIPIVYINEEESPAMKRGGFIAPVTRHIRCIVEDGVRIPDYIEMDCTGLKLKDVIRMDRIIFPEGVRVSKTVNKQKFLVGTVFGRRSEVGDE
jgi:large subunit ribosomal protein L25